MTNLDLELPVWILIIVMFGLKTMEKKIHRKMDNV